MRKSRTLFEKWNHGAFGLSKILLIYDSRTGNTEKMAEAVKEGAKTVQGVDVDEWASLGERADYDAIVIGVPTYHHQMTEGVKNFLDQTGVGNVSLEGKFGAAFGSYGWSGEAPQLALEIMENKLKMKVLKPPLLIKYTPDESGLEQCRRLGKKVAEQTSRSS